MNIKLLSPYAVVPTRGSVEAAGWDLYAAVQEIVHLAPHETAKIPTDIAVEIPHGYFGAIYPRSGKATKEGVRCANCVGKLNSSIYIEK
jgi:dUTP pyrophosphatase